MVLRMINNGFGHGGYTEERGPSPVCLHWCVPKSFVFAFLIKVDKRGRGQRILARSTPNHDQTIFLFS